VGRPWVKSAFLRLFRFRSPSELGSASVITKPVPLRDGCARTFFHRQGIIHSGKFLTATAVVGLGP
jgi:hypothetical protein